MKHPKGTLVKILKPTDDTMASDFIGKQGVVVDHNDNGMTGNTQKDPMHAVMFDDNTVPRFHRNYKTSLVKVEAFWYEELEIVKSKKDKR